MATLPGLSFDPYSGLPTKKTSPGTPAFGGISTSGLGGQLGGNLVASGGTPAGLLGGYSGAAAGGAPAPFTLPDFSSLISNDPLYQQSLADLGASHAGNLSALTRGLRQAIVQYGEVPDQAALGQLGLPPDALTGLNDETRQLAATNTSNHLSTVARLSDAMQQGRSQLLRQLASRGALQSGESGYQLGRLQTNYNQGLNDAAQQLLGLLGNEYGQYTQSENQITSAERQAAEDAANRASMQALLAALAGYGSGGGGGNPTSSPAPTNPTAGANVGGGYQTAPQAIESYFGSHPGMQALRTASGRGFLA